MYIQIQCPHTSTSRESQAFLHRKINAGFSPILKAAMHGLGSFILSPVHQPTLEIHIDLRAVLRWLEIGELQLGCGYNSLPAAR